MDYKKIGKNISRSASWWALNLSSFILNFLPGCLIYDFAKNLGFLGYLIARKQRKTALESLDIAFGNEKTKSQKEKIARDCFTTIAKGGVELIYLMARPELLRKRVELTGKENLEAAFAQGRGVILASAHLGNFPLMLGKLCLEGYKIGAIMRPMRDSRVEEFFAKKRSKFNLRAIYSYPRKECVETTIRALRNNEAIFIPMDQNFGSGGIFVDFFGKKAATAAGPVVLALRTKAVILPCFIVRNEDNTHKVIFEPPLALDDYNKPGQDNITGIIQKLTKIIESYVRKYPVEWSWIHRRWKSQ